MSRESAAPAPEAGQLMTASMLTHVGRIERCRIPVPRPGPGELVARVLHTGICGSDLATYRGRHPYKRPPVVLGHEMVAVVEELGPGVDTLAPGRLVCSAAFRPCEACGPCRSGAIHLCSDRRNLSHDGWQGSFAEFVLLHTAMTYPVPDHVEAWTAALAEPLSIALHAVRRIPAEVRGRLVVLGLGGIGLACVLVARRLGFQDVVAVDLGPHKAALAARVGTHRYLDAAAGDPASPPGATRSDATVVTTGHEGALDQARAMTAPGGHVVVVSYSGAPRILDIDAWLASEVTLLPSQLANRSDVETVLGWLADGSLDPTPMVTHRFPLDEAAAAFRFLDGDGARTAGRVLLTAGASTPTLPSSPTEGASR